MSQRKVVALLLAFVGPWGIGQFHLGRRARGIVWLAAPMLGLVVFGLLFPRIGERAGWGFAVALPFVVMFVAWALSVGDLLLVREGEKVPIWQTLLFVGLGIVLPGVASVVVRALVLESFVVPTESMQPAVLAGDRIFADKSDRRARYGDVIVFASPEHPEQTLVKRVVALPGDSLEVKNGRPFVNGWAVPSCPLGSATLGGASGDVELEFLGDASYLVFHDATPAPAHAGPLYAAPDGVLVLGDDRNESADSRTWSSGRDGNVHRSSLRGRALFVWMRTSADDDARFGVDLGHPVLPAGLAHLRPALDKCMASRPNATPPAPLVR